ncbi:small-conductance mechanosensitive channel [Candidatus Nitrososphaera evergladensis SR1]|uniref:Small-conductance mechanosensitive channel n=1 Tax=Candidatus Nitrososphaera evergladensis SR1 TaxID=1459636 RepID=A0A075MV24_9ARCH|nr:mechanosensitive ion channel family protein [Candidatus Nitrososphaera evergladensis]AIF85506.1 small-conductance mechanosensitive channel [Candidatus Nitrososphaera evergladensis SR1]
MTIVSTYQLAGIPNTINVFGAEVEVFRVILTIIVIVAGVGLAYFAKAVTSRYIGTKLPPGTRKNMGRMVYYGIIAIALLSALGISHLDLSGIFLAGGIAGIVIGFATQSLFSNLISGIFLYIDKPMKVGDPVLVTGKLPDIAAVVIEVTALSTRFRMFDGTYVRLPNTEVFSSEIRNFSGAAARRVEIQIRVGLHEDKAKVLSIIRNILADNPLVLVEPEPDVYVDSVGDSGVNINIWAWAPFTEWFPVRKQLVEQVMLELEKNHVEVPLPQRVVHLDIKSNNSDRGFLSPFRGREIREGEGIDDQRDRNVDFSGTK